MINILYDVYIHTHLRHSFQLAVNRGHFKDVVTVTMPKLDPHGAGNIISVSRVLTLPAPVDQFVQPIVSSRRYRSMGLILRALYLYPYAYKRILIYLYIISPIHSFCNCLTYVYTFSYR